MHPHRSVDFLRTSQPFRIRGYQRRSFWKRLGLGIAGFALVSAIAAGGVVSYAAVRVMSDVNAGKQAVADAQAAAQALELDKAFADLAQAESDFSAAKRRLDGYLFLSGAPYFGGQLSAADRLLEGGVAASSAAREVLGVMRDIVASASETEALSGALLGAAPDPKTVFKDLTAAQKREMLATLSASAPKLGAAAERAAAAVAALDRISQDPEAGPLISSSVASVRDKLTKFQSAVAALAPVSEMLPWILGYPDERSFLVFLANNTELRPVGGFLGTYGLVSMRDAEVVALETHDVYSLDGPAESGPRPKPPAPIAKYIGLDKWYLRDANWSPDFGSSSRVIEQFFREEYPGAHGGAEAPRIDGTIVITPQLAIDLLRITGPLTVDGHKFDADNLVDELEYQVEQGFVSAGIAASDRKQIVGKLVSELVKRLSGMPLSTLTKVVDAVSADLDESQIVIAVHDDRIRRFVEDHDWGGIMKTTSGDYLSVIDANLASLKTDYVIDRSVKYSLKPDGQGGYLASAALTYRNNGRFTWKTTRYRTYTRVYAPKGAQFVSVTGAMQNDKLKDPKRLPGTADVSEELGKAVFGAFISIEPGETRTLTFNYRLPASVADQIGLGAYGLDVEKQAGTLEPRLTLDLDFGKKLRWADPAEKPDDFGDTHYRVDSDLRTDRHFDVRF